MIQVLVFYIHTFCDYYTLYILVSESMFLVNSMKLEVGLGELIPPTLSII